jgi:photosystem II stability/assembly factor-like uncharacterized protein
MKTVVITSKLNFAIGLFLLLSVSVSGQLQWQPLPSAVSNINNQRFDDVFFISDDIGWALNGAYASVYKTTDGGLTWTQQLNEIALGGNYYFRNIEFLTPQIGFVGTLNNVFFKTTDGGDTWAPVTNFTTNPTAICGLDTVGTSTVYGCGAFFTPAHIIKSIDAGVTWQYIDMAAYATSLVEILFLDENTGYVSGSNAGGAVVLKTIDGGATWTEMFNSGIPGEYVWKLQILSSNSNVIFGSIESIDPYIGKLIKSTDAGATWVTKNAPEIVIQAVGFMTENHGWMGGHTTGFHETTDGGDTWTNLNIGSNLNRIFIINDNLAYASGTTIYKYSDGNLGVNNFQESNRVPLKVRVQPNPIVDKLSVTIEFPDADHLVMELYDNMGKRLRELKLEEIQKASRKTYEFDFPYPSGVYYVNVHCNTGRQSVKVVK